VPLGGRVLLAGGLPGGGTVLPMARRGSALDPEVAQFREMWADELGGAALYRALADHADERRRPIFLALAEAEERHAAHWAERMREAGIADLKPPRLPFRIRVLRRLARLVGTEAVLPIVLRAEAADADKYRSIAAAPAAMAAQEQMHGKVVAAMRGGNTAGGRIAAELWLAIEEYTLPSVGELGVFGALGLPPSFDEILMEEAAAMLPPDGDASLLAMAVLFHPKPPARADARERAALLADRFEFPAETRERVLAAAFDAPALAHTIEHAQRPSELHAALAGKPVEAVAVAGALGARRSPEIRRRAQQWLSELRGVGLEIGGDDLLAAGVPQGPEIGRRLERALGRRLDGELGAGRDAELAAALEAEALEAEA